MNFGVLRVFNDDYIVGENGFGAHPHRDMEIVTIIHKGELTHADSMGNTKIITAGEVQYMSAGTGVVHSEVNNSKEETHLYQIWLSPKKQGLTPTYDQKDFKGIRENNVLQVVASGDALSGAIHIQADATISLLQTDAKNTVPYHLEKGRGLFIYVTEGSLTVLGQMLSVGDQARIQDEESVTLLVEENTLCIVIDVRL